MKISFRDAVFTGMVILIFLFCISLQFPDATKDVKITDWLSFFCNAALAGVAIRGFFLAKNWKQTLTENKAVDAGFRLNYQLLQTCQDALFSLRSSTLKHQLPEKFREGFFDEMRAVRFFKSKQRLYDDLDKFRDNIYEVRECTGRIHFCGWEICADKARALSRLDDYLNAFYLISFEMDDLFDACFSTHDLYLARDKALPVIRFAEEAAPVKKTVMALNDFFICPQRFHAFMCIVEKMMAVRESSLQTMRILINNNQEMLDLIKPREN